LRIDPSTPPGQSRNSGSGRSSGAGQRTGVITAISSFDPDAVAGSGTDN
jgi:hypothetical protein